MSEEENVETTEEEKTGMPVKQEIFLEAGVHIGTKIRTNDMRPYVFKRRDDGLYILDLRKSADRLVYAAKMMSMYKPEDVLVIASRVYSSNPAGRFSMLTDIPVVQGRFIPGTFTNVTCSSFREPKLVIVCDPKGEKEAIRESAKNGIPVIALCDTDNEIKFIDLVVPINNKGKKSLALTFYILARELMMTQGKISDYSEFTKDIHYFEQPPPEKKEQEKAEEAAEALEQEKEKAEKEAAEAEEKAKEEKEEEETADKALKAAKENSKEKPAKEESKKEDSKKPEGKKDEEKKSEDKPEEKKEESKKAPGKDSEEKKSPKEEKPAKMNDAGKEKSKDESKEKPESEKPKPEPKAEAKEESSEEASKKESKTDSK
jgi:small subunit ribosomal protein S2